MTTARPAFNDITDKSFPAGTKLQMRNTMVRLRDQGRTAFALCEVPISSIQPTQSPKLRQRNQIDQNPKLLGPAKNRKTTEVNKSRTDVATTIATLTPTETALTTSTLNNDTKIMVDNLLPPNLGCP